MIDRYSTTAAPRAGGRIGPRRLLAAAAVLAFGAGPAAANDFPTQARVEFVLECMDASGGQSYDTLYACVCMVDKLAEAYSFDAYTQAQTLSFLYGTPGERGGVFRDAAPDARARVKGFRTHREAAREQCFVPAPKASTE